MTTTFVAYHQKEKERQQVAMFTPLCSCLASTRDTNLLAHLILNQTESSFETRPSSHIYHLRQCLIT